MRKESKNYTLPPSPPKGKLRRENPTEIGKGLKSLSQSESMPTFITGFFQFEVCNIVLGR